MIIELSPFPFIHPWFYYASLLMDVVFLSKIKNTLAKPRTPDPFTTVPNFVHPLPIKVWNVLHVLSCQENEGIPIFKKEYLKDAVQKNESFLKTRIEKKNTYTVRTALSSSFWKYNYHPYAVCTLTRCIRYQST